VIAKDKVKRIKEKIGLALFPIHFYFLSFFTSLFHISFIIFPLFLSFILYLYIIFLLIIFPNTDL